MQYVDIFVNHFVNVAQQRHLKQVCRSLLHVINTDICPLSSSDPPQQHNPVCHCDCSQHSVKLVLGWVIDTTIMSMYLSEHCHKPQHLHDILASIPPTQCCTSLWEWCWVLCKLQFMLFPLSGSQYLFSWLQTALALNPGHSITREMQCPQQLLLACTQSYTMAHTSCLPLWSRATMMLPTWNVVASVLSSNSDHMRGIYPCTNSVPLLATTHPGLLGFIH